jgi:uncharacterized protein YwqG
VSRESIAEIAREAGFGAHAAALAASERECVQVHPVPAGGTALAPGTSRVGGWPDLPLNQEWPRWNGSSLAFIAQFNLADLARFPAAQALPPEGQLAFFYHAEQQTWGFDPKDRGSFRVIHLAAKQLEPRALPEDLPESAQFPTCAVSLESALSLPPFESRDFPSIGPYSDKVGELLDGLAEFHSSSRSILFGYAGQIQGDMQDECALVTAGLYCGDPSGYNDPRAAALRKQGPEWQLLFQVASEDAASMVWGDVGCLYYWMRGADLQRHAFDQAWMILQCS